MNDKPHLDEEALAELKDVLEDEFGILIQTYINDSRERLETLRKTLTTGEQGVFASAAHSFKGSSINIGAARLGHLCAEAEAAGKEDRLADAAAIVPMLEAEFEVVRRLMEESLQT